MHQVVIPLERRGFGQTMRRDAWWAQPLLTFTVLGAFVVYATWAAFQGEHYEFGPYLSPFYSPLLFGEGPHSWFGPKPGWWPAALPFSAALLILWAPGGFRFTCYYYRGAYYKAFWADPPSCAVGEPRKNYLGERSFPLILQNIHRYFLYLAILSCSSWPTTSGRRCGSPTRRGRRRSASASARSSSPSNTVLLSCYTLGCHSFRHLVGGVLDQFSRHPARLKLYDAANCLNCRHMKFAWASLFSVALADLYVRLCSMGVLTDWRLL